MSGGGQFSAHGGTGSRSLLPPLGPQESPEKLSIGEGVS